MQNLGKKEGVIPEEKSSADNPQPSTVIGGAQLGSSVVSGKAVQSEGLNALIIVPGHGVYTGERSCDPKNDDNWAGIFQGEGKYYMEHAQYAVMQASQRPNSLLVFSGGKTRYAAGPMSEGQSYWRMSDQQGWQGTSEVRNRAVSEDYARDSAENVLFGLYRFFQVTGKVPDEVFVCGWGFKADRFKLHWKGITDQYQVILQGMPFPINFTYLGVNNPEGTKDDAKTPFGGAMRGEAKALSLYNEDPLGGINETLLQKKSERDPFRQGGAEVYGYLQEDFKQALVAAARNKSTPLIIPNVPLKSKLNS